MLRGFEVRVTHTGGAAKRVAEIVAQHRGASAVAVGIQGAQATAAHDGGSLSTADIGMVHEFGLGVPERAFMRRTFETRAADINKLGVALERRMVRNETAMDVALKTIGAAVVGFVQATIANGVPPPNAPATVARKGSSTPLVDTGQLRNSITSEIRRGK